MYKSFHAGLIALIWTLAASAQSNDYAVRPDSSATPDTGVVKFFESVDWLTAATNNFFAVRGCANLLAADTTLRLPCADGTASQVLSTDGAGLLSWQTVAGVAGTSSGPLNAVQLSDGAGGFIDDDAAFHFDAVNNRLGLGTITPSWPIHVLSTANELTSVRTQNTSIGVAAAAGFIVQSNSATLTLGSAGSGNTGTSFGEPLANNSVVTANPGGLHMGTTGVNQVVWGVNNVARARLLTGSPGGFRVEDGTALLQMVPNLAAGFRTLSSDFGVMVQQGPSILTQVGFAGQTAIRLGSLDFNWNDTAKLLNVNGDVVLGDAASLVSFFSGAGTSPFVLDGSTIPKILEIESSGAIRMRNVGLADVAIDISPDGSNTGLFGAISVKAGANSIAMELESGTGTGDIIRFSDSLGSVRSGVTNGGSPYATSDPVGADDLARKSWIEAGAGANLMTLGTAQTVTALKTFNAGITSTSALTLSATDDAVLQGGLDVSIEADSNVDVYLDADNDATGQTFKILKHLAAPDTVFQVTDTGAVSMDGSITSSGTGLNLFLGSIQSTIGFVSTDLSTNSTAGLDISALATGADVRITTNDNITLAPGNDVQLNPGVGNQVVVNGNMTVTGNIDIPAVGDLTTTIIRGIGTAGVSIFADQNSDTDFVLTVADDISIIASGAGLTESITLNSAGSIVFIQNGVTAISRDCAVGEVMLDPKYTNGLLVEGTCGAN